MGRQHQGMDRPGVRQVPEGISASPRGQWRTGRNGENWLQNYFSMFSTALWDLPYFRPVHSLMLSSQLFFCLPCLLPPFAVPCKMVLARPDEQETCPYHCSLCHLMMVWRSLCGLFACLILAWTSLLVTWSLYERCSILL